eukprot:13510161-Alexandrium_andersonii.AAC.1
MEGCEPGRRLPTPTLGDQPSRRGWIATRSTAASTSTAAAAWASTRTETVPPTGDAGGCAEAARGRPVPGEAAMPSR